MKNETKCKWFGHKWEVVYINKEGKYKFIAVYCERCRYGDKELLDFIIKNQPIINTFNPKYF